MSPRTAKAYRDFWLERSRSSLVVLAIALGIAAFSSVLASYAILDRELNQGYLATNPASFTIRTDAIDDSVVDAVRSVPGVGLVEARRVASGRLKAGPTNWRNVMFFVVKDYGAIRVSTITPETGAWPPGPGEVLIERDAFQVAKTKVGESIRVRMASGVERALRVTGGVHDVGQAQARMENVVYAYITLDTLIDLGEEPYFDQLKVVVAADLFNRDHVAQVASAVKARLEGTGHAVRRVDIPDPGKHPHADLMGMLLLAISTFGLLVLALSGVIVVNLLTALMAAQVRQIGVMKAIGGTQGQIARIYFAQALLIGVAAVVVGLPLGLLGSRALCRYLATFLNFDLTSLSIPWWVYGLVALIGLLTPLLAAIYPIRRGSALPVASALSDFGVASGTFGVGVLDRRLAALGGASRPVLFAMRNSFRRRIRLALTLVTLSVAGLFFLSALNVRASMMNTIDHLFASKLFDLSLNLGPLAPFDAAERAVRKTSGAKDVEGWIATEASLTTKPTVGANEATEAHQAASADGHGGATPDDVGVFRFSVLGIPAETRLLKLDISEGRNLRPGDVDALVINSALATRQPSLKVGGALTLRMGPSQSTWRVVGISNEAFSPPVGYISKAYFERAGHVGMANTARIAVNPSEVGELNGFREALDQNLEAEGVKALSSTSKTESRYGFDQHMLMVYVFLLVMSVIIGSVGGLGLMTTMSLNVLERRREMGVLRAIGASSRMVWLIVVVEGLTIGGLSFAIASLAAGPVSKGLGNFIGAAMFRSDVAFTFEWWGLAIWLVASLLLSALASFLPAWNASRSPVRDALGFE